MPYMIVERDDEFCVYREGDDGTPMGESLGCHATRDDAEAQLAALWAAEVDKQAVDDATDAVEVVTDAVSEAVTADILAYAAQALPTVVADAVEEALASQAHDEADDEADDATDDAADDETGDAMDAKASAWTAREVWQMRLRQLFPKHQRLTPGVHVTKGKAGQRLMLIITSNSYRDRDGEQITTAALKADTDRHWRDGRYFGQQPLLWWHDDRLPIGNIIFGDVRGAFLVEVAKERRTPAAKVIWDYVEAHPEVGWGASHRFEFQQKDRLPSGLFTAVRKLETSLLPRAAAANPFTFSGILGEKAMNERDAWLNKIFAHEVGIEDASALLDKGIAHLMTELAKAGLAHKARKQLDPDVAATLDQLIEELGALHEELQAFREQLMAQMTAQAAQAEALAKLRKQVRGLRTAADARPRSASRASATIVDETELTEAAKQGRYRYDPFWRAAMRG